MIYRPCIATFIKPLWNSIWPQCRRCFCTASTSLSLGEVISMPNLISPRSGMSIRRPFSLLFPVYKGVFFFFFSCAPFTRLKIPLYNMLLWISFILTFLLKCSALPWTAKQFLSWHVIYSDNRMPLVLLTKETEGSLCCRILSFLHHTEVNQGIKKALFFLSLS